MGITLNLVGDGGEHETDLCSNHGWTLAAEWMGGLDVGTYPMPVALARDGFVNGTDVLAEQLEAAFAVSPPSNPEVKDTVDRLLDLIGDGRPEETASVGA